MTGAWAGDLPQLISQVSTQGRISCICLGPLGEFFRECPTVTLLLLLRISPTPSLRGSVSPWTGKPCILSYWNFLGFLT